MSFQEASTLGSRASIDTFGNLRVSTGATIFHSDLQYGLANNLWDNQIDNGVVLASPSTLTHLPNESAAELKLAPAAVPANSVHRLTRSVVRYQPGKSQLLKKTFVFGAKAPDVFREVGFRQGALGNNGIYLQQTPTTLNCVIDNFATGAKVSDVVPQANWNLDKMDGTGGSGITLDDTKGQILIIDYQWLSLGIVRFGFDIKSLGNESIVYVHTFFHANLITTPYITTGNLHIHERIYNVAGTNAGGEVLKTICTSVESEGGNDPGEDKGDPHAFSTGLTGIQTGVLFPVFPLLAIKQGDLFNGMINESVGIIKSISVLSDNKPLFYQVIKNANLTGTTWFPNTAETAFELSNVITYTPGGPNEDILAEDYVGNKTTNNLDNLSMDREALVKRPFSAVGGGDTLLVTVSGLGVSSKAYASIGLVGHHG